MPQHTATTSSRLSIPAGGMIGRPACDPAIRVTKSLLGYGVIVGPVYVAVALAQALLRPGFDLTRHQWSLLCDGPLGWIQVANFIGCGLMVIAFAIGLRRALVGGVGARWTPRLLTGYGAGLVGVGIFRADPALGFPIGTPPGPAPLSWHGLLHFACGGIGFIALAAACFVMGRRYATAGRPGWAAVSRLTGAVFLAGFAMVASGGGNRVGTVVFTATVIWVWTWMAAVAVDCYRRVSASGTTPR